MAPLLRLSTVQRGISGGSPSSSILEENRGQYTMSFWRATVLHSIEQEFNGFSEAMQSQAELQM